MKMYVGITDYDWFKTLKQAECEEVNFWKPVGGTNFRALDVGDIFLFKLHSPRNYIVGGGFFLQFSRLPTSLAWKAFKISNGANSLHELNNRVYKYRKTDHLNDPDPQIGCIILSNPIFFNKEDWIPVPENWRNGIVQGKLYDTSEYYGNNLYNQVQEKTNNQQSYFEGLKDEGIYNGHRYGKELLYKPRLGQGSFKVAITDAYNRRCAITAEKTLPVLEASHIKPYSLDGPHEISNGLLLRSDFHTLFDRCYITIDEEFKTNMLTYSSIAGGVVQRNIFYYKETKMIIG